MAERGTMDALTGGGRQIMGMSAVGSSGSLGIIPGGVVDHLLKQQERDLTAAEHRSADAAPAPRLPR